jgi:hypothetical protein
MELTNHARIRQQQRGIPPMVIELLIKFGACEKAGDGTSKYFLDGRSSRQLQAYAGQLFRLIEEYLNCYAVVCPEGRVVTVAHRIKRIKR